MEDQILLMVKARHWAWSCMFGIVLEGLWHMLLKFNEWGPILRTGNRAGDEVHPISVRINWQWCHAEVPQVCWLSYDLWCRDDLDKNGKSGCQRAPDRLCRVAVKGLHPRWRHWMKSSMVKISLNVLSTDVQGTWLNAPMLEEIYAAAGHELGAAKLVDGCYCLFVFHLVWSWMLPEVGTTATVCGEVFICNEDPDMWMRPRVKLNGDVLKVFPTLCEWCSLHPT